MFSKFSKNLRFRISFQCFLFLLTKTVLLLNRFSIASEEAAIRGLANNLPKLLLGPPDEDIRHKGITKEKPCTCFGEPTMP